MFPYAPLYPAFTTTPSLAATKLAPIGAPMSTPVCNLYTPVIGCVLIPYFDVILVYPGVGQANTPPIYCVSNPSNANFNISAFTSANCLLYSSICACMFFSSSDSFAIKFSLTVFVFSSILAVLVWFAFIVASCS